MPTIVLATALARWLSPPPSGEPRFAVTGTSLKPALDELFGLHPQLRGYVMDEHGRLRAQVAIVIDGQNLDDKTRLHTPLDDDSEVYLRQSPSAG
ncbi:molybdopterin synthase subunit MoaD [Tahibacter aquaticus]|uniref:Molybdopterin synthase subunit MoaD n=1 Tax=Tahibacter aquaticus TaxID=520092 RepID=A0A4V3DM40_9GAMM|nr:MoaD/ThiS family protein [Tahibacter aquaticus]TDR42576.1 molybdopterin synthase subunit MoaD [Tahibacter aquaticus]